MCGTEKITRKISSRHSLLPCWSEPWNGASRRPPQWRPYSAGWQTPAQGPSPDWLSRYPVGCNHYDPRQKLLHLSHKDSESQLWLPQKDEVKVNREFVHQPSVASRTWGPLPQLTLTTFLPLKKSSFLGTMVLWLSDVPRQLLQLSPNANTWSRRKRKRGGGVKHPTGISEKVVSGKTRR